MNYLNKAIKAHQDNNLTLAKELYLAQIKLNSKDPNAKQLLGLIYFNEQDYQNARVYMEASLKLNKKQPHVITNLGSVYLKQSNSQMAVDCFKSAIEIDKNYVEAYINLARTFRQLKDYDNSEKVIIEATKLFSNNLIIIKEYGALLKATDRYIDLVKLYEPLLNTFTDKKITFDYALALRIIGKSEEALLYFHALEKDGMSNYQLFHNIGNSYSDIGQLSQAINYYARAINQNMLYVDSHKNLNELIWETGQFDIFLSSYVTAIKHYPDDPALNFGYIASLIRASKHEFAKTCMNELPGSLSNYEDYYLLQAKVLNHDGLIDDAIDKLKEGLSIFSPSNDYLLELSKNLIASSQFVEAEKLLESLLANQPNNQMAIAYIGVCYGATNKDKECQLNNYDNLVKVFDLTNFPDVSSVPNFFEELNNYLSSLHTSNTQPLEQTLSNGSQTRGNIFDSLFVYRLFK
jgi:tetratricopeptide (TPR) repeat protein